MGFFKTEPVCARCSGVLDYCDVYEVRITEAGEEMEPAWLCSAVCLMVWAAGCVDLDVS